MTPPRTADVVVVGAGAAGCVVARRLAEAGADVVLVEAGDQRASTRAGLLDIGPGSRVVHRYCAELGTRVLELPRGRTLGGSGAVNGGYCTPARPADVAAWGPDWPQRYAVGLARATERLRPRLAPAGPVAARVTAAFPTRATAIAQARRGDRRVTAHDAWDPAGAGVRVVTGAPVRALRWAGGRVGGRCDGVVLGRRGTAGRGDDRNDGNGHGNHHENDDDDVIAAREVILCAGAIGTAALLLGSGIGPASGHPVGAATQEHPEVLLDLPGPDPGSAAASVPDAFPPTGELPPLLSHVVRLGLPTAAGVAEVEVRPYSAPFHRVIPGLDPQPQRIGVALMNPLGRGRISLDGPGGRVRVVLADDPRDAAVLEEAAALVAGKLGLPVTADGRAAALSSSTSHHLGCSAPIGAVTDASGRVHGVEGLRVMDASVLPALPRCGPYLSVLAVAEDLATRVAAGGAW